MAIHYGFEVKGDLLVVTTSGFDETLADAEQYTVDIIDACNTNACQRVLCDEREFEYRLDTVDTYQLAEFAAEAAPRVRRVAIVTGAANLEDGKFYETVARNRGLYVRIFGSMEAARAWLDE